MCAQPVFADRAAVPAASPAAGVPPASPFLIEADVDAARRLRLAGSRHEIGRQHGAALREPIARFLHDRVARLEPLVSARRLHEFAPLIAAHTREIERVLPELAEEIHGVADGADIATEDAFLLQLRRELSGFQRIPARGDCTTFGRHAQGESIVAQTIDLNGAMAAELSVLEIAGEASGNGTNGAPAGTGRASVALASFTGLTGYVGINDRGVAIGMNLVLGGVWRPGIPGYLAIRHMLDRCASVDECLDTLRALPLASSRALTIADATRVVTVEYTPDALVVLEGAQLAHTNHFLHPELTADDALNPFARTSSLRRLDACRELVASLPAAPDARDCLDGLGRAPIEVLPNGDVRRECTVASVAMFPGRRALHVRSRPAEAAAAAPAAQP